MNNAATLCDMLGIPLLLDPPRDLYMHGWGQDCLDPKLIECSWTLTLHDIDGQPTSFTFDLVEGDSPLLLGLDIKQHSNTMNITTPRYIKFKRPEDKSPRRFVSYIKPDPVDGTLRLRMELVPHSNSTVRSLMANIKKRPDLSLAKKVHRYTHATIEEMKGIFKNAGRLTDGLQTALENVFDACEICNSSGRPHNMKKLSLSHIDKAFNNEIQVDFLWCDIKGTKYCILNITDTATCYGERVIASSRSVGSMTKLIESHWICQHGAPGGISSDPEFDTAEMKKFLQQHNITFLPRPARRHNKTGIVERNNGVFKAILKRVEREKTTATAMTLVARASFLGNMFSGSKVLSAFQLARGYSPSILGLPKSVVTPELLEAHREQVSIRAIHRILKARVPHTIPTRVLKPGTKVWVYFNTSKQNEATRWLAATVVEAQKDFVLCRRSKHGRPMSIAYEDLRLAPTGPLTKELLACTLEEELSSTNDEEDDESLNSTPEEDADQHPVQPSHRVAHTTERENKQVRFSSKPTLIPDEPPPSPPSCIDGDNDDTPIPISGRGGGLRLKLNLRDDNELIPFHPSLLSTRTVGQPEKDIGSVRVQDEQPIAGDLTSDRQRILKEVRAEIGSRQVSRNKLEFAPPWLVEEAFNTEHSSNWVDAYAEVDENEVPADANVITSHVIYKVKTDENEVLKLKGRIVPHGNKDTEIDDIRKDSSTAQFNVILLLLCLTTFLGFRIGLADVMGAYLQSGPIARDIYVRPPREWMGNRKKLWKLIKLPYGIVEAGRQWQKVIEEWMLNEAGLERIFGISQLYRKRDKNGSTILLVAKVTDDLLFSGSIRQMKAFAAQLERRFNISKALIDKPVIFNGCSITQNATGSILMSMKAYADGIQPIPLSRSRKKTTARNGHGRRDIALQRSRGCSRLVGKWSLTTSIVCCLTHATEAQLSQGFTPSRG